MTRTDKRRSPSTPPQTPYRAKRRPIVRSRPLSSLSRHLQHSRQTRSSQTLSQTRSAFKAAQQAREVDENNEQDEHVIVAVNKTSKKKIGCSYYHAREGVLYCMEDTTDLDGSVLDMLKFDLQPTILLLNPASDVSEQELKRQSESENSGVSPPPYQIELRPKADFAFETAMQKLSGLTELEASSDVRFLVPGNQDTGVFLPRESFDEDGMNEVRGLELFISSYLDTDNQVSIGCAGSVLTYLQRRRASEYLGNDPAGDMVYRILRLEMFSLKDIMLINTDTLAGLQIIQPESHPNAARQGPGSSGAKESLSIYGLFYHFARSPQGKQKLRHILLHPSLDVDMIRERHNCIAVFTDLDNLDILPKMSKSLNKIKNLRRVVISLRKGVEGGNSSSETFREITGIQGLQLYQTLANVFDRDEFKLIGKAIYNKVDIEESQSQSRTCIKRGIRQELDVIKDEYDAMDEILQQVAMEISHDFPSELTRPTIAVTYLPQLGYHITLPLPEVVKVERHAEQLAWQRVFVTESQAYFKTPRMRDMDAQLGDLYATICDEEIEISHELAQDVLVYEDVLIKASDLCGELDALLALAHGAVEYNLTRPTMVEQNVVDIHGGRHLLQELTVPLYVTNDTKMVGGEDLPVEQEAESPIPARSPHSLTQKQFQHDIQQFSTTSLPHLLLVTGPNYSGKSVYLKSVALTCYLAQTGSFVPCTSARLGLTDRILTRITSRETVSKQRSSFMIDLQQMSWCLKHFTNRSLLIIDEFGKGTDPSDGAGLMAGVVAHLLHLPDELRPKVLASTHFHEIFEQGHIPEDTPGLGLRHMEVHIRKRAQGRLRDKETLSSSASASGFSSSVAEMAQTESNTEITYLYNLKPGRSTLSYGIQCAALNGIPEVIVRRARQLHDLMLAGEDLVDICSQVTPNEASRYERAEDVSRAFLSLDIDALEANESIDIFQLLNDLFCGSDDTGSSKFSEGEGRYDQEARTYSIEAV